MPIDKMGREWTRDGRPVGWSDSPSYRNAGNGGGAIGFFGGMFVLAIAALILGVIAFVGARAWELVTVWEPGDGTYEVSGQIPSTIASLHNIVVKDDTMTVTFELTGNSTGINCPAAGSAPRLGFGENVRIVATHLWDVYDNDTFRPTDWECRGKEGQSLTYAAGEPILFWASFPLEDEFDLELNAVITSDKNSHWSEPFKLSDLPRSDA
ncbi:hypothetical protein JIG36_33995 [Actinoplanes sp. LDG1-06]|uniref:DUF4352 domain-containing protein n=1 Tax=Paractinoplanes ovalisporus TaxID=2810368 RepID=A0ABS2AL60_9ACTN|nr:hypothetical protein [Actinoplanes ovalisporus]MBM2620525.1 hypothetical protein [Actinoplanes ovalisporus]